MSITLDSILDLILGNLGTLVILVFILYGGFKGWWVFGWYAKELNRRIDRLETRLDQTSHLASTATEQTTKVVNLAERRTETTGSA